ncbi:hypothetical protein TI03_03620 [Achromatium sp. WMS1]|nr:hypothetical protein TI03_03620 [Achromatium sp. WMS1]
MSIPKKVGSVFQSRMFVLTVGLGVLDIILYSLLFQFSDELNRLAEAVYNGQVVYILVPLSLAMIFVLVHATFTDYLWELIGLRTRR